jgi:hypothetical protein
MPRRRREFEDALTPDWFAADDRYCLQDGSLVKESAPQLRHFDH